ncbi:MAG: pyridoxal phosphate-dependent aminotransferase [Parachlamydiaceae bacterium]
MKNTSLLLEQIKLSSTSQIKQMADKRWTDTISLAGGEPRFEIPEGCLRAVLEDDSATKYSPARGYPDLVQLIQQKLEKVNGIKVNEDQIICVTGGCNGIFSTLMALTNPGDEVLLPDPSWEYLSNMVTLARSVPKRFNYVFNGHRYQPDWEDLKKQITPKTKAIIINSPLNPLGSVLTQQEIQSLSEICAHHGVWMISDEVAETYVFEGNKHLSPAATYDHVITIHSFSKSFALTGIRLGYVSGPKKVIDLIQRYTLFCNMYPPSPSQRIAHRILSSDYQSFMEEVRCTFERKMERFAKGLEGIEGIEFWKPEGGLFLFPKFTLQTEKSLYEILIHEYHLLSVPGESFGAQGKNHLRLFYGVDETLIDQAIKRIESMNTHYMENTCVKY